jgi:antigen flippase
MSRKDSHSYGEMVSSATILGGSQVVVYAASLVRNKFLAIVVGVAGIGAAGLYQSVLAFIHAGTNLGVSTSGVREMAASEDDAGEMRKAKTAAVINRISWLTGVLGLLASLALAPVLSHWLFHSPSESGTLALLGPVVLFTALAAGRTAVLQGLREIKRLAAVQVATAVISIPTFILLCWILGIKGIVPSMLLISISTWLLTVLATPKSLRCSSVVSWSETWLRSRHLLMLGLAFMWNLLISGALAFGTRALIVRELGIEANGIFQAAWTLSAMFVGFALTAMSMDFLPRLSAQAHDNQETARLVNEQTEVGLLLAIPGLLMTVALAPVLVPLLYTAQFEASVILIPWLAAGCLGQIISWPAGFVQIAKGRSHAYALTQSIFHFVHLILIYFGLRWFGLVGVAAALPVVYCLYTFGILRYLWLQDDFTWSRSVVRLGMLVVAVASFLLCAVIFLPSKESMIVGVIVSGAMCVYSIRTLLHKLETTHPWRWILLPAGRISGLD